MIIKRGEKVPGLEPYVRQTRIVMAKKMKEAFIVETMKEDAWERGRRGDWLVHIGGHLWSAISDDEFRKIYRPAKDTDCMGPGDVDRRDGGDRRGA